MFLCSSQFRKREIIGANVHIDQNNFFLNYSISSFKKILIDPLYRCKILAQKSIWPVRAIINYELK